MPRLPILVVEDDEPTRKLLETVLRRAGFSSEMAADGAQAISLVGANDYALIVLDMMMPTTGGRDVLAFLSATGSRIPVIVCSAAGPAALSAFDPAMVKAVVRKPFDVLQFTDTVLATARHDDS